MKVPRQLQPRCAHGHLCHTSIAARTEAHRTRAHQQHSVNSPVTARQGCVGQFATDGDSGKWHELGTPRWIALQKALCGNIWRQRTTILGSAGAVPWLLALLSEAAVVMRTMALLLLAAVSMLSACCVAAAPVVPTDGMVIKVRCWCGVGAVRRSQLRLSCRSRLGSGGSGALYAVIVRIPCSGGLIKRRVML